MKCERKQWREMGERRVLKSEQGTVRWAKISVKPLYAKAFKTKANLNTNLDPDGLMASPGIPWVSVWLCLLASLQTNDSFCGESHFKTKCSVMRMSLIILG